MAYTKHYSKRITPQTEQTEENEVKNNAGGWTFKLEPLDYARRFLILGSESPTYYVSAKKLTIDNSRGLEKLWETDPEALGKLVYEVSDKALAPKNDPALWALSLGAASKNAEARKIALGLLPKVARTSTHLFHFLEYAKAHRGWGSGLKKAVAKWYSEKSPQSLALQAIKYRQRDGWTHRDALRLSHPPINGSETRGAVYDFMCRGGKSTHLAKLKDTAIEGYISLLEASTAKNHKAMAEIIDKHKLPWEAVPSDDLNAVPILEALAPHLGETALIRNLPRYTAAGLLKPFSNMANDFCERITDASALKRGRIHPMQLLVANGAYQLKENANKQILEALEEAFILAFAAVEPANKRTLLGLDVSGSMSSPFMHNNAMTCSVVAAAMAMVTLHTEPKAMLYAFDQGFRDLGITKKHGLAHIVSKVTNVNGGGTDCALPMTYALENKWEIDTFVVYTDNETWAGKIKPHQALQLYRQKMGIDAKLIVVGITATEFTIADPADKGMLDVVGFDASAPAVMARFSAGSI